MSGLGEWLRDPFSAGLTRGTALALARALACAALAVACAWPLRCVRLATSRTAALVFAALLAMPALAVAYAWTALAPAALQSDRLAPLMVVALLAARAVPLALLVFAVVPPPAFAGAAAHVAALAPPGSGVARWARRWWLRHGEGRVAAAAFAAAALLTFLEFEITARFAQPSWTVWLFDALAGGVAVGDVALASALPAGVALALASVAFAAARAPGHAPARAASHRPPVSASLGIGLALGAVALVPLGLLLSDGLAHLAAALRAAATCAELAASIAYAATAALLATAIVARVHRPVLLLALCLPAALGNLTLGLAVRALAPVWLADTVLPLAVALTLALLPWAALLARLRSAAAPTRATHVAALLTQLGPQPARAGARIRRALLGHPQLWSASLLLPLALQDVTLAAALAPPQAPPLTLRLHNLAHYGHSHTLSALLLALVAVAVVGVAAASLCRGAASERD